MRMRGVRTRTTEHFRRDGLAKKSYASFAEADGQAKRESKNAYRCRFCKQWHIGGKRGR